MTAHEHHHARPGQQHGQQHAGPGGRASSPVRDDDGPLAAAAPTADAEPLRRGIPTLVKVTAGVVFAGAALVALGVVPLSLAFSALALGGCLLLHPLMGHGGQGGHRH